jgi:hypothetical protein
MIYRRTGSEERAQGLGETVRTHVGLVVKSGSTYLGDGDSTYWAVVSDGKGGFETIGYCSTYCICFSTGDRCRAEIDPSPELAAAYLEQQTRADEISTVSRNAWDADAAWHRPGKGAIVRVVRGRKVPVGLEGRVGWTGDSKFGERIGIMPPTGGDQLLFTAASNVEVIERPDLGIDPCGRVIDRVPVAPAEITGPIVEMGLPLEFEGRPDFRETRIGCFVAPGDPSRYWGYAVIPARALGHQTMIALHFSGQSDWGVARVTASTYSPVHPQHLLEWLLRPTNAPTAAYRPGEIPPFFDPRRADGSRRIVESLWELAKAGNPSGGISVPIA